MLTFWDEWSGAQSNPSQARLPIILFSGTSSSGKTTASQELKIIIENSGHKVSMIAYDEVAAANKEALHSFLDEKVKKQGFEAGLEEALKNKLNLSNEQILALETIVDSSTTAWIHQKITEYIIRAHHSGQIVIVDALDTHDIVDRLSNYRLGHATINILMYVPLVAFPDRIFQRNKEALKNYHASLDLAFLNNCRDPLDIVEQYATFFEFVPSKELSENTLPIEEIKAILEKLLQGTIELLNAIQAIYESLDAKEEANDIINERGKLLAEKENKMSHILKLLLKDSAKLYLCQQKKNYDLAIDTLKLPPKDIAFYIMNQINDHPLFLSSKSGALTNG